MSLYHAARELERRNILRAKIRAQLHEHQQRVLDCPDRWVAVTCSRRAGKTVLDAALLVDAAANAGPDEACVYIARSRKDAETLIWGKLKELVRSLGLLEQGWSILEAKLQIRAANGAFIALYGAQGADHEETMNALRGLKMRLAIYDEPANYVDTIERMTREVVEPALGDTRGKLVVNGTPGIVLSGWWFEVSTGRGANPRSKWTRLKWTVRDNPFFRDPEQWLREALDENGWTDENPTYQREYLGRWVADDSALVYRFTRDRNMRPLPADYGPHWAHTLGVDFALRRDACAWAVLASHPHRREVYVVRAFKRFGIMPEKAAEITHELRERYHVDFTAADSGGLGAPYVEAYASRFGVHLEHADKRDKRGHIELANGDFCAPRLFVVSSDADELASELEVLPWHNDAREKEHPSYANDCSDAFLYAYVRHRAYLHTLPQRPAASHNARRMIADEAQIEHEAEALLQEQSRAWWDR